MHDIGDIRAADASSIVLEYVGFSRRDDKTQLIGATGGQSLDQVFAYGFGKVFVLHLDRTQGEVSVGGN